MAEGTFFSSAHGTLESIPHVRPQNKSTNSRRQIKQGMFSYYNGKKLEINSSRKTGKSTDMWKLNYTLLTNGSKNSRGKLENTFETSKNQNNIPSLQDA